MSLLTQSISQLTAAANAGMSERTARKHAHSGRTPSQAKVPHTAGFPALNPPYFLVLDPPCVGHRRVPFEQMITRLASWRKVSGL